MPGRRDRGLNLVETIIAFFIITIGVLMVSSLFESALSADKRTEKVNIATVIAQKNVNRIRDWAKTGNNFTNWSSIDGITAPDPQYNDYNVTTDSEFVTQYSPCSLSESRFPPGQQRTMTRSLRKVRVRVAWDPTRPSQNVSLVAMVGAPGRELDTVTITNSSAVTNPLPQLQTATFAATATDTMGAPVTDLFYQWWVLPKTGAGQVAPARDGRTATFTNLYYFDPNPPPGANIFADPGSSCDLAAQAQYRGVVKSARTNITLGGP